MASLDSLYDTLIARRAEPEDTSSPLAGTPR